MAKRYIRVGGGLGWQNAPSTLTPRNATNLNIMDKGIKDCDDAIGDLVLLKTVAKTDLVTAINEQNDNLIEYLKSQSGAINSSTNWDTISQGIYPVIDTTGLNAPPVSYPYGLVLVTDTVGVFAVRLEIYFPHVAEAYPVYRVRFDGNWLAWKGFAA